MSEFELGVLRARMLDADQAKARRGELRISVPVGYVWHRDYGLGLDPDQRLQETIQLIFERFRHLASARQTLLSLADEGLHFPRPSDGKRLTSFEWTPIRYRNVISLLKNPFYAGVYAYGKGEGAFERLDNHRPLSSRFALEPVGEDCHGLGEHAGIKAESSLDDARLAADVARDVE